MNLSDAEIAGFMNWTGPGAYTVHAMRRVKRAIKEAVRRENEACAALADEYSDAINVAEAIRARGVRAEQA